MRKWSDSWEYWESKDSSWDGMGGSTFDNFVRLCIYNALMTTAYVIWGGGALYAPVH